MKFIKYCIFLFFSFSCLAQNVEQFEVPFSSKNGFSGNANLEVTYALENFFKLKIRLKKVLITGFKTSLGTFSKDELSEDGISFPLTCNDCALKIRGASVFEDVPFEFNSNLQNNTVVTVNIKKAVPEEENAYQQAKKEWETNLSISEIEVLLLEGSQKDAIVHAAKQYGKKRMDQDKLNALVNDLSSSSESEWKNKIYANRSGFYDKNVPDSLLQLVAAGKFKPVTAPTTTASSAYEASIAIENNQQKTVKTENKSTRVAPINCTEKITLLEARKKQALAEEDYLAAASFKSLITELKANCNAIENNELIIDAALPASQLNIPVEEEKITEPEMESLASYLPETKAQEANKTNTLTAIIGAEEEPTQLSELTKEQVNDTNDTNNLEAIVTSKPKRKSNKARKLSKVNFDFSSDLTKYKRSSLHSMMLQNPGAEQADVIEQTFLDRPLPEKFNTHHISKNFISVARKARKQDKAITAYLNQNAIARELVAKWFNRNEKGEFNMDLIAERGHYNATVFDVNIAKKSERGLAMLADAGEQLIGNTFVIITDYKYTNKEEVAKKTGFVSSLISAAASAAGASDLALVADAVTVGTAVAGKGYVVKATSYLYRLVWNPYVAQTFYNEMWIDEHTFDANKKRAFETTDLFKLALVGYETDWSAVQSTAFTTKSDAELIQRATIKATDQTIAKLQRKYEIFRTKTPLISSEPLAAKIGLKEGLEKGDKFEVLEQFLKKDGTIGYKKVGVIKVDKYNIWDNRYAAAEEENSSATNYTMFSGSKNKYYQGMLIRQIN